MTSTEPLPPSEAAPADTEAAAAQPHAGSDPSSSHSDDAGLGPRLGADVDVDADAVADAVEDSAAVPAAHAGADASVSVPVDDHASAAHTQAHADAGPRLRKLFPALFGHQAKPLKLQIQNDIQARAPGEFSKKALSAFFRRYTGSHAYLNAVAHAKSRFDLDGQPAGELSVEHRTAAAQELTRRRANQQARIELEEQQRRNRATLLRDFQSTTLTPANFCALKGVAIDELEGLLAIAREELAVRNRQTHAPHANARPDARLNAGAPRDPRAGQPREPSSDLSRQNPRQRDERGAQARRGPARPPTDARRR